MAGSRTKVRGSVSDQKRSASAGWCSSSTRWSRSPPCCSFSASSPGPWSLQSKLGRSSPTGSPGLVSTSPGSTLGHRWPLFCHPFSCPLDHLECPQDGWALFVAYIYFSKYGSIRLGREDSRPEYNDLTWSVVTASC